ncbi:hypothetical protein INS49_008290 [Diaporthe citri]|uniref:uncharacterized protein n=1 Tax=Diaporthe citri TaxID=83186 RepID=UPI001C7F4589|nr:uncharacterized protein INS49_008290 [Diaporthe citri]KAG6363194.1 hypothetical protein INS49_008290 [Diaporthe citri]
MPYKTPSRRGASAQKPFTPRKRGLFEDGQWLCECTPRKPALCLTVKKDSPNKGKRFYTCQDNPKKCDFFLWEEEAMKRERDALLLHNCNSENGVTTSVRAKTPEPAPPLDLPAPKPAAPTISQYFERPGASKQRIFKGLDAPRGSHPSQSSDTDDEADALVASQTLRGSVSSKSLNSDAAAAGAGPVTPTAKRKRGVFLEDSDEEFGGDDLNDSDTERQLAAITDESAEAAARPGLLIGQDERERSAKRQRHAGSPPIRAGDDDDETQSQPGQGNVPGDPETPTPYRKTDALAGLKNTTTAAKTAGNAAPAADDYPKITDEVFSLLAHQPVSESTKRTLKAAMERHEMRVRGVVRGREAARAGVAERDARIGELQDRVVALENGRRMDRERLRELSSGLLKLSQED